nr:MAG: hypothetical protein AmFV_00206 [Apis mellifera filamentous virus]
METSEKKQAKKMNTRLQTIVQLLYFFIKTPQNTSKHQAQGDTTNTTNNTTRANSTKRVQVPDESTQRQHTTTRRTR